MNDPKRIVQIQEQVLRIGRQPAAKSFLDSCDPNGLPWLLNSIDQEVAFQHHRWTEQWGWKKLIWKVILTIGLPLAFLGGCILFLDYLKS